MLAQPVLLLGIFGHLALSGQDAADQTPPIARAAIKWVEAQPLQVFDVYSGEDLVAWASLQASIHVRGESTYLELVTLRRSPADAEFARREVAWLRLDSTLSPERLMLFEASENASQLARVGVVEGKLTGKVHGRAIVRNVPEPIGTDSVLLLRAGLMAKEGEGRERICHLVFGRRSAEIALDETLSFAGSRGEGQARVVEVKRHGSRGLAKAVYRFDGEGGLIGLEILGRDGERWIRRPAADDD